MLTVDLTSSIGAYDTMQAGCDCWCWARPLSLAVMLSTRLTRISGWGRCALACFLVCFCAWVFGCFGSVISMPAMRERSLVIAA